MDIRTVVDNFTDADVQALAVAVFKDEKTDEGFLHELDVATNGLIKSVIESGELKGKEGETVYLHLAPQQNNLKAKRLLLIGVGERGDYKTPQVSQAAGTAARALRGRNVKSIGFVLREVENAEVGAAAATEGAFMSLFDIDSYRTFDKEDKTVESFVVIAPKANADDLKRGAERGRIIAESVNLTRTLANEPSNNMTPTILAERAQAVAKEFGLEIDVLDEARMEELGMGSFLCVSQGSEQPANMIILKYTPAGGAKQDDKNLLALVGKAVTFDTGGISLKPSENMEAMKYDMTGGATVIGAMRAVAQLKPSIPVLGVVPATENMPSGTATKPGDIVRAMNGKTIEVINTDAEGRLILADAMCYAKKLGATQIIDMATLTGAVIIALGDINTGVMGTDQKLIDAIIACGAEVGEKYWQLPLNKEYTKQIKSDIADIKNVGGRKAGTITAAAFLKEFAEDVSWAHLDIAGTAWLDDAKPYRSKGPSGVAVRTLLTYIEHAAKNGLATDNKEATK
ncbi:MAG: leucyl aminopeptidase [Pyrinomonadaceae bacterium]